jgi:hypothetical protein
MTFRAQWNSRTGLTVTGQHGATQARRWRVEVKATYQFTVQEAQAVIDGETYEQGAVVLRKEQWVWPMSEKRFFISVLADRVQAELMTKLHPGEVLKYAEFVAFGR